MKDMIFAVVVVAIAYIAINSGVHISNEMLFLGTIGGILAVWWIADGVGISRGIRAAQSPAEKAHKAGFGCGWLIAVALTLLLLASIGKVNGWW
jgi:hypothetical protein